MSFASVPSSSFILLTVSEKKNFEYFFENLPFMSPRQPIKLSDLDKSRMKHGGLLNKHFCKKKSNIPNNLDKSHMKRRGLLNKHFCLKKNPNIPNETEKIVNFLFSHYKSIGTISCHSNQNSYPIGTKNTTFRSPYL